MTDDIAKIIFIIDHIIDLTLSKLFHNTLFQTIESNWRSLNNLLDADYDLLIYTLEVAELKNILPKLIQHIKNDFYDMPGRFPFSLLCIEKIDYYHALQPITKYCHLPLLCYNKYKVQQLARHPYSCEYCLVPSDFLWSHAFFHFLKPTKLPLKKITHCNTKALEQNILIARLNHCIKIQLRDAIGRFSSIAQFQFALQHWIHQYTSQTQSSPNYPLEFASILIESGHNKNNYICHIRLKIHNDDSITSTNLNFKRI